MSHTCEGCGVSHKTAVAAQECFAAHQKLEYTYDHLEAGACMWEHVLAQLNRRTKPDPKVNRPNAWDDYREAYGVATLRSTVIRHAPELQKAYERAVDNGYTDSFDWDFVPKYMEDHVTRILV